MVEKHSYTTDGRVEHYSKDKEINIKLGEIIGEEFIKYRQLWDAVNRYEIETDFPLFIQLDMAQKCNLSCIHCPLNSIEMFSGIYSEDEFTFEDYKKVVNEGQDHDCPSLSPSGLNEPLLMKDFEKYIKYAHNHGFIDIMINTNATVLTEEKAKKLLDSGLTRIRFSIDAATPESYKKIRKNDNYYKVINNINRFLDLKESGGYKLPVTGANFCKININEDEVKDFFEYWSNKVDIVTTQTYVPPISEARYLHLYPSDQFGLEGRLKNFQCPQPFQRVVLRNHYITPCCGFYPQLKMGDIRSDSIYEVWNSKSMKDIRSLHKNKEYYKNDACRICANLFYPQKDLCNLDTSKVEQNC